MTGSRSSLIFYLSYMAALAWVFYLIFLGYAAIVDSLVAEGLNFTSLYP